MSLLFIKTRTKTSIRYNKENDRETREGRREREKGRRRYIEKEGERDVRNRERESERERDRALIRRNYEEKLSASILCRGKMWELLGYWRIQ